MEAEVGFSEEERGGREVAQLKYGERGDNFVLLVLSYLFVGSGMEFLLSDLRQGAVPLLLSCRAHP